MPPPPILLPRPGGGSQSPGEKAPRAGRSSPLAVLSPGALRAVASAQPGSHPLSSLQQGSTRRLEGASHKRQSLRDPGKL